MDGPAEKPRTGDDQSKSRQEEPAELPRLLLGDAVGKELLQPVGLQIR
jgi:hypothetical protein